MSLRSYRYGGRYGRRRGYGTRYGSTRYYTGISRSTTRSVFTRRGRRLFGRGRRGSFKRNLRRFAEKKYSDSVVNSQYNVTPYINDSGQIFILTEPIQGNTDFTRIGNKVTGTSLEVNYTIKAEPPDGLTYVPKLVYIHRVIIFIWKDDTTPTPGDILDLPITLNVPYYPLNHDKKVKRKILYDETHTGYCDVQFFSGVWQPAITRRFSIPLTKLKNGLDTINFTASTTGINQIYVLMINNVPVGSEATSQWSIVSYYRYNFVDV